MLEQQYFINWNKLEQIELLCIPENHQYLRFDVNSFKSNKLIFTRNNCPMKLIELYDTVFRNGFNPRYCSLGSLINFEIENINENCEKYLIIF